MGVLCDTAYSKPQTAFPWRIDIYAKPVKPMDQLTSAELVVWCKQSPAIEEKGLIARIQSLYYNGAALLKAANGPNR